MLRHQDCDDGAIKSGIKRIKSGKIGQSPKQS